MRYLACFLIGLAFSPQPAVARQADPVAVETDPVAAPASATQFYVLSFTDAPIAEIAEAVIGGALAQSVSVDPAIAGTMSFRADGWFTGDQLMQEYGTALLDRDIALVRSRDGDLAMVPRDELPRELARGAALMALSEPSASPAVPVVRAKAAAAPIVYGEDRWWDGGIGKAMLFLTGALSGAAAVLTGQRVAARRKAPSRTRLLALADRSARAPARPAAEDSELVIPRFEDQHRSG